MGCNCGRGGGSAIGGKIMGAYGNLRPHQIRARLEIFKRNFCTDCGDRYKCDYNMYLKCNIRPRKEV